MTRKNDKCLKFLPPLLFLKFLSNTICLIFILKVSCLILLSIPSVVCSLVLPLSFYRCYVDKLSLFFNNFMNFEIEYFVLKNFKWTSNNVLVSQTFRRMWCQLDQVISWIVIGKIALICDINALKNRYMYLSIQIRTLVG